jgi:two-component system phosphate regulon sensor histidine kinase PhoR
MKIPSLKAIIISCSVFVVFSFGIQFLILKRIYNNERKQFDKQVATSVSALFQHSILFGDHSNLRNSLEHSNGNNYLVPFDSITDPLQAMDELMLEFSHYELTCGFRMFMYFPNDRGYSKIYSVETSDGGIKKIELHGINLQPPIQRQHLNIEVPDKNEILFKKIRPWLLSCVLLISSLTAIAISLYHFYKRRFWNNVQKGFINNLIHEFRTPLAVISISSKVLQGNGVEKDSNRLKKYARIIKDQTDQLQHKVDQILILSLSGKKSSYLNKENVDVNTLIENALGLVEPLIKEKKASVEFIPSVKPTSISADGNYLTQAIVNLLDNSLKYANSPFIRLESAITAKNCSISIRDNGIGMEKKYFKYIFRKYYRIPTGDVHNVKGFGIGLNFVKNVVNAHKGHIEVSSIPGKGTEFRINLPLT